MPDAMIKELDSVVLTTDLRTKLLEQESAELQQQAEKLADEIKELSGAETSKIG